MCQTLVRFRIIPRSREANLLLKNFKKVVTKVVDDRPVSKKTVTAIGSLPTPKNADARDDVIPVSSPNGKRITILKRPFGTAKNPVSKHLGVLPEITDGIHFSPTPEYVQRNDGMTTVCQDYPSGDADDDSSNGSNDTRDGYRRPSTGKTKGTVSNGAPKREVILEKWGDSAYPDVQKQAVLVKLHKSQPAVRVVYEYHLLTDPNYASESSLSNYLAVGSTITNFQNRKSACGDLLKTLRRYETGDYLASFEARQNVLLNHHTEQDSLFEMDF